MEMVIAQTCRCHDEATVVKERVLSYRRQRESLVTKSEKRRLDRQLLEQVANEASVLADSLSAYADVNFRYPKLTGLFSSKGQRLDFNEQKLTIIHWLISSGGPDLVDDPQKYLSRLWVGAPLPTDNEIEVRSEISRLRGLLGDEQPERIDATGMDPKSLNIVRLNLEERYREQLEICFAKKQSSDDQLSEIITLIKVIGGNSSALEVLDFDIDDRPAYLEWTAWRAFLAINDLVSPPHISRRFRLDQDFFPLGCAPGGGPDMTLDRKSVV